jgi:hypothetical protein
LLPTVLEAEDPQERYNATFGRVERRLSPR